MPFFLVGVCLCDLSVIDDVQGQKESLVFLGEPGIESGQNNPVR